MATSLLTFMYANSSFDDARFVLFGCPFDGTVSYRPGARFGPNALRDASWGTEDYSTYQKKSLLSLRVHDMGDIEIAPGNTLKALESISAVAGEIVNEGKIPVAFGGEHLISLPVIRAVYDKYPELHVIHFDAHMDLRQDYMGEPYSHATIMRRVLDFLPPSRLFQFGIRSGTQEEHQFALQNTILHETTVDAARVVADKIGKAPVYITVDLDVFDPAYFPGTGTPEPGGIDFNTFIRMLKVWAGRLNVVGFDAVELAPKLDSSGISDVLAAKVVREMLLAF